MTDKTEQTSTSMSNPEPVVNYTTQKIHQFPSKLRTISKFKSSGIENEPEFYLVDEKNLYHVANHELVYGFKFDQMHRLESNTTHYGNRCYIYNFPSLIEIYTESVKINNAYSKTRIIITKNEYNEKSFKPIATESFDIESCNYLTLIGHILVTHHCCYIHVNDNGNNSQHQTNSKHQMAPNFQNTRSDINRFDLEKMTHTKITGLHLQTIKNEKHRLDPNYFKPSYDELIIDNRFCIIFDTVYYIIYDLVANREINQFENRSGFENNSHFVLNRIEYVDDLLILHQQNPEKADIYILTTTDQKIPIRDDECVICFSKTNKYQALYPCGHARYCESCIDKIKTTKCAICNTQIQSVMRIYF